MCNKNKKVPACDHPIVDVDRGAMFCVLCGAPLSTMGGSHSAITDRIMGYPDNAYREDEDM